MSCFESLHTLISESVAGSDGSGRCLYVSGVPGTGKTATVLEVMRSLRKEVEAQKLPGFQFAEMNSLRLPSPQHAYTQLYEAGLSLSQNPSFRSAADLLCKGMD